MVEAFTALEWSKPRLWRYETGQVPIHPNLVEIMCRLYGADDETIEGLKALARETKTKGWWHAYSDIPEWIGLFLGMEAAASRVRSYQAELIPGLLQSPRYAEAIVSLGPKALSPEAVGRIVESRIRRQRILTRRAPKAADQEFILNEAALVRGFSPEIISDQLQRLNSLSDLPNVSVRVIPFKAGMHLANQGPFVMMDFPRESRIRDPEPTTVYDDRPTGALYLDRPNEVKTYSVIWDFLDKKALDQSASRALISQKAEEWAR